MSICEISKCAKSFTIQIKNSANPVTSTPNIAVILGSRKDRMIFRNPMVKTPATNGKAITVQILVRGLIV